MAGTFTNKRSLNNVYRSRKVSGTGGTVGVDASVYTGFQLTTSYRTNRRQTDEEAVQQWLDTTQNGYQPQYAGRYDNGHEFYTKKSVSGLSLPAFDGRTTRTTSPFYPISYRGPLDVFKVGTDTSVFPTVNPMTDSELLNLGSKAIANTTPTNPASSVVQTLGELITEGLPKALSAIPTLAERAAILRSAGDKYLNVQFGWIPFLNDLFGIFRAVIEFNSIVRQYERDSGRWVRRKYRFPVLATASANISLGTGQVGMLGLSRSDIQSFFLSPGLDTGNLSYMDTVQQRTWFSGCYTYYLNGGQQSLDKLVRAEDEINRVLGTRLTPDVIWQITPWTWLFDWFFNAQEAITNFSRFQSDSLVLRYGYLMRHTVASRIYAVGPLYLKSGGTITPKKTFQVVQKERYRATPYGFALNVEDFNPQRIATLIALGFTKTPGRWQ